MANEFKLSGTLTYAKNSITIPATLNYSLTVSGDPFINNVQTIGTTEEALTVGDIATVGLCYFRNMDTTNFVLLGRTDGGTFREVAKLKAGEFAIFRAALNAINAKADTAPIKLQCWLISD